MIEQQDVDAVCAREFGGQWEGIKANPLLAWQARQQVLSILNAAVTQGWATPAEVAELRKAANALDHDQLISRIEFALFGTTEGGLIADESSVPVGELRRLLRERATTENPF